MLISISWLWWIICSWHSSDVECSRLLGQMVPDLWIGNPFEYLREGWVLYHSRLLQPFCSGIEGLIVQLSEHIKVRSIHCGSTNRPPHLINLLLTTQQRSSSRTCRASEWDFSDSGLHSGPRQVGDLLRWVPILLSFSILDPRNWPSSSLSILLQGSSSMLCLGYRVWSLPIIIIYLSAQCWRIQCGLQECCT